jgi:DNA repair exonuclease SbcCD ATPase subunit
LTASGLTQAAADATRAYENAVSAKSDAENRLKRANDEQQQAEAVLKKCRAEYSSVYEQAFVAPDSIASVCPTCGQSIPEEQYAQAVEKAQAEYESRKKASLQEITRRGNAAKKDCEV